MISAAERRHVYRAACCVCAALLLLKPSLLPERLETMSMVFQLPLEALGPTLTRAPGLLLLPPAALEAQLVTLTAVLNITHEKAAVAAVEHPLLLLLPAKELNARLQTLADALQVRGGGRHWVSPGVWCGACRSVQQGWLPAAQFLVGRNKRCHFERTPKAALCLWAGVMKAALHGVHTQCRLRTPPPPTPAPLPLCPLLCAPTSPL